MWVGGVGGGGPTDYFVYPNLSWGWVGLWQLMISVCEIILNIKKNLYLGQAGARFYSTGIQRQDYSISLMIKYTIIA